MTSYSGQYVYRQISPALWLGLVALPFVFVWCLLGRGYSPRSRIIAFGAIGAIVLYGTLTYKPEPKPAAPTVAVAPEPSKKLLDEQAREERTANRDAAEDAYLALLRADRGYTVEGESIEDYNLAITAAYKRWVSAEKAYHGENWQAGFVATNTTTADDCKQYYGSFISEDDTIRTMRAVCAAKVSAGAPTVPTLESLLLKAKAAAPVDELSADHLEDAEGAVQQAAIYQPE